MLEDERALVRSFQRRQKELYGRDIDAEREASRRRVGELEAEVKMMRSLAQVRAPSQRKGPARAPPHEPHPMSPTP